MISKYIHLLAFITLFTACKKDNKYFKSKDNSTSINLVKSNEFTVQPPDSISIGTFSELFSINNNNSRFAFYDKVTKQILVTNDEGKTLNVIGGNGRGPKEFLQVFGYDFDEKNNVIVYDNRQLRLKIFSPAGEIIKNVTLEGERKNHFIASINLYAHEDKVYFGILESEYTTRNVETPFWKSKLIAVYNYNGKLLRKVGQYDPSFHDRKYYRYSPVIYFNPQNLMMYSSHEYNYRIQSWNMKNNYSRKAYFGFKPPNFKVLNQDDIPSPLPKKDRIKLYTQQSYISAISANNSYIFLLFQNIPDRYFQTKDATYKDYFLTLYDLRSNNFKAELKLPYPMAAMNRDKIYLVEDDNPESYTIGVYELEE